MCPEGKWNRAGVGGLSESEETASPGFLSLKVEPHNPTECSWGSDMMRVQRRSGQQCEGPEEPACIRLVPLNTLGPQIQIPASSPSSPENTPTTLLGDAGTQPFLPLQPTPVGNPRP